MVLATTSSTLFANTASAPQSGIAKMIGLKFTRFFTSAKNKVLSFLHIFYICWIMWIKSLNFKSFVSYYLKEKGCFRATFFSDLFILIGSGVGTSGPPHEDM